MKASLERCLGTLFHSKWNRNITEELSYRSLIAVFAPHFLTRNSVDSEVIYVLKTIYQILSDEIFVNILAVKLSYKIGERA